MSKYVPTIGLEIHAELSTKTKMFCASKNDTNETRPNVNVCPVCMGHPGTLPVMNKEAVKQVLRVGTAVGGELADYTEFDRKNYFYPDIPKGYQISQYKHPLVKGGSIAGVAITRIHLEEDTAKSYHKDDMSLVDFNRAGVPLMELVTEPVIADGQTAAKFAKELQLLLWCLGASEANMEKGEMRVEVNISISRFNLEDSKKVKPLGTKVEVKNLNSFKAVEKAIAYEIDRQEALLDKGEKIVQETRGWDENKEETFSQRAKEESHDYRYFPDPDLPKLLIGEIPEFAKDALKNSLPELPWERRERLLSEYKLKEDIAEIFVKDTEWGKFFDEVAKELKSPELAVSASNYIATELDKPISVLEFAHVIRMLSSKDLSSRGAKEVIKILSKDGGKAREVAEKNGLIQKSDEGEMKALVEKVIGENEQAVKEYRGGKLSSLQFLIGQAMKASKGSGNPEILKKIFEEMLA